MRKKRKIGRTVTGNINGITSRTTAQPVGRGGERERKTKTEREGGV
jgi:hypothetical protein